MNTSRILIDLIYHIEDRTTGMDEVLVDMLRVATDKLGPATVAEFITKHPHAGYSVRYLDDLAPKLAQKEYLDNIKIAHDEILKILK
jgi:hypothetical protein